MCHGRQGNIVRRTHDRENKLVKKVVKEKLLVCTGLKMRGTIFACTDIHIGTGYIERLANTIGYIILYTYTNCFLIFFYLILIFYAYIPLINRVRGPYGSLWPKNFFAVLCPKREARGAISSHKLEAISSISSISSRGLKLPYGPSQRG